MTPRPRHDDPGDAVGLVAQRAPNGNMRVTIPLAALAALAAYFGFDSSHDRDKVQEQLAETTKKIAVIESRYEDMQRTLQRIESAVSGCASESVPRVRR